MALRAVQKGYYYKNGGKVLTYEVQGPLAEVAEYIAAESIRRNVPTDQISKNGNWPIMFISEQAEMQNGRTPQPSYLITKNHDGTRWNRDTTAEDQKLYAQVNAAKVNAMGDILAKRALGIDVGDRAQRAVGTTRPQGAIAAPIVDTATDDIAGAIAAGAALTEGDEQPVGAGVEPTGDENLGQ